jgi:hypothetical protein
MMGSHVAKPSASRTGTSRIRFILLDAEIAEGDLGQITTAIQNALKPNGTATHRLSSQPAPRIESSGIAEAYPDLENGLIDQTIEAPPEADAPRAPREAPTRKPTAPKVLDLDMTSGVSLESFAATHAPKNDIERNLVVLAWFKEHRKEEAVTANHVYTGYRALKWPSGIDDFSWPLRALKRDQLVTSPARGQ